MSDGPGPGQAQPLAGAAFAATRGLTTQLRSAWGRASQNPLGFPSLARFGMGFASFKLSPMLAEVMARDLSYFPSPNYSLVIFLLSLMGSNWVPSSPGA